MDVFFIYLYLFQPLLTAFIALLSVSLFARLNWRWQSTYSTKLDAYNQIIEIISEFRAGASHLHKTHDPESAEEKIKSEYLSSLAKAELLIHSYFSDDSNEAYKLFVQVSKLVILHPDSWVGWDVDTDGEPIFKEQENEKFQKFISIMKKELNNSKKVFWIFK